jgi:cytochrome c-type protein NapC
MEIFAFLFLTAVLMPAFAIAAVGSYRLELALHEWARFKANDSLECRNCHSSQSMDITKQSPRASVAHQRFLFNGEKTCIDCHKGIAHHLPDMRGIPGWQ